MSRLDISVRSATRTEILFRKLEKVDNSCTVLSGLVDGAANIDQYQRSLATRCRFHFRGCAAVIVRRVLFRSDGSNR